MRFRKLKKGCLHVCSPRFFVNLRLGFYIPFSYTQQLSAESLLGIHFQVIYIQVFLIHREVTLIRKVIMLPWLLNSVVGQKGDLRRFQVSKRSEYYTHTHTHKGVKGLEFTLVVGNLVAPIMFGRNWELDLQKPKF
jgi:hypothetical protein